MPQSTAAAISGSTDVLPAAPRPGRLALRLVRCRQHRTVKHWLGRIGQDHRDREALGGTTACPISVSLTLSGQRRNGRYRPLGGAAEMWSLDCKRRLRMRPPPPTAAMMRARRMMDAMTCTALLATAMGPPHELRRCCLWLIRQEPFCLAIAIENGQTEYIF